MKEENIMFCKKNNIEWCRKQKYCKLDYIMDNRLGPKNYKGVCFKCRKEWLEKEGEVENGN